MNVLLRQQKTADVLTNANKNKEDHPGITLKLLLLKPNQYGKSKRASEWYFSVKAASLQTGSAFISLSVQTWLFVVAQLCRASVKSI